MMMYPMSADENEFVGAATYQDALERLNGEASEKQQEQNPAAAAGAKGEIRTRTTALPPSKGEKPVIELGPRDSPRLGEVVAAAMQHLASNGTNIFQRGGALMRPVVEPGFDARGRPVKVSSLIDMDEAILKMVLMRDLRWAQKTKDGDGVRYVNPGYEVPRLILKARGAWPFPAVSGLINAPTLRSDGSLLQQEGYDAATGLLLLNAPSVVINPKPTRADAEAALQTLKGLLVEAPFESDASRAVALSLIFSTMLCGALDASPLHLLVSPTAGTGKSFIVDIASLIATGRRCAVVAATRSDEELEKRIGAAMLSGRPLISLDNLNGLLASNLLCQAVSQLVVSFRPLGVSEEIEVTMRSVFAATGNNLAIADDLGRRTILASLDARVERPWERKFKQDPLEMIASDRARYISAALTIPLAYLAEGMPNLPSDLNGFSQWSRLVRAALMWLGEADPLETMRVVREGDPKLQASTSMLFAMREAFGDRAHTAAEMVGLVDEKEGCKGLKEFLAAPSEAGPKQKALREAMAGVCKDGKISATSLSYWLRARNGQIISGLRLRGEADRTRLMHWRVVDDPS